MSGLENGGPAFPQIREFGSLKFTGMTLRDWFAGQFLAGAMANAALKVTPDEGQSDPEALAASAYLMAGEMLKERLK